MMVLMVGLLSPFSMSDRMALLTPDSLASCPKVRLRSIRSCFKFMAMIRPKSQSIRLLLFRLTNILNSCKIYCNTVR